MGSNRSIYRDIQLFLEACRTTSVELANVKLENGYQIRDFKGVTLYEAHLERFKLFSWRPRPPTLVTKEQQRKIRRNLKDYSHEFEAEDEAEAAGASQEL